MADYPPFTPASATSGAAALTAASPGTLVVGVANQVALPAAARKAASFVNSGTSTISLGLGRSATAAPGPDIVLLPGGSWDGRLGTVTWLGSVHAASSAAGGALAVVEV